MSVGAPADRKADGLKRRSTVAQLMKGAIVSEAEDSAYDTDVDIALKLENEQLKREVANLKKSVVLQAASHSSCREGRWHNHDVAHTPHTREQLVALLLPCLGSV